VPVLAAIVGTQPDLRFSWRESVHTAYNGHMTATQTQLAIEPAGTRPGPRGDHRMYSLAAERRAVEEGHNARVQPDGSILVRSETTPVSYRVWIRDVRDGVLRFGCTCRSGQHRRALPVPCKHAALAGRRLERERIAEWTDGQWRLRDRAQVLGARRLLAGTMEHRRAARPAAVPFPAAEAA
jgi:hypothetical protein